MHFAALQWYSIARQLWKCVFGDISSLVGMESGFCCSASCRCWSVHPPSSGSSWSSWLTLSWRTEEACRSLGSKLEKWRFISISLIVNMDLTYYVSSFPAWQWNQWPTLVLSQLAILGHSCPHSSLLTTLQGDATHCPISSEYVVSLCSHFLTAAAFPPPQWLSKASLSICQSQPISAFLLATDFIELPFSLKSLVRPRSSSCIRIST